MFPIPITRIMIEDVFGDKTDEVIADDYTEVGDGLYYRTGDKHKTPAAAWLLERVVGAMTNSELLRAKDAE